MIQVYFNFLKLEYKDPNPINKPIIPTPSVIPERFPVLALDDPKLPILTDADDSAHGKKVDIIQTIEKSNPSLFEFFIIMFFMLIINLMIY